MGIIKIYIILFTCLFSISISANTFLENLKTNDKNRAKYWKKQGYNFNPNRMSAFLMDQKVKDILRAKYWKKQGYNFNPDRMTAFSMDQAVKQVNSHNRGKIQNIKKPKKYVQVDSIPVQSPSVYRNFGLTGCESGHWIDSVSDDGSIIKLEDGSIIEVDSIDTVDSSLWLPASEIVFCNGKLINIDDGESVEAERLR